MYRPTTSRHLLDEQGVGGELEGLRAVGLEAERPPDATNRAVADPKLVGHRAGAPVCGTFGCALQGGHDQGFDYVVSDRARRACALVVEQTPGAGARQIGVAICSRYLHPCRRTWRLQCRCGLRRTNITMRARAARLCDTVARRW